MMTFQEPIDANETYSDDISNPTDKSRDGPICQQGSLNRFILMALNGMKMEDVIGLVLKVNLCSLLLQIMMKHVLYPNEFDVGNCVFAID